MLLIVKVIDFLNKRRVFSNIVNVLMHRMSDGTVSLKVMPKSEGLTHQSRMVLVQLYDGVMFQWFRAGAEFQWFDKFICLLLGHSNHLATNIIICRYNTIKDHLNYTSYIIVSINFLTHTLRGVHMNQPPLEN